MDNMMNEINELFAECTPQSEFVTTEYSFVAQGVKVTRELPEQFLIRLVESERKLGMHVATQGQLEQFDDAVDVNTDTIECMYCGSPEARMVGATIFTRWNKPMQVSMEIGERLAPVCNCCMKLDSEKRPGPNHQLPPSGDLLSYSRENTRENWSF